MDPSPALAATACLCSRRSPAGTLLQHRLQRHLVHTLDSEQNLHVHSLLTSIVMAPASTLSARSLPGIHEPLLCVCGNHRCPSLTTIRELLQQRPHRHKRKTVAGIATATKKKDTVARIAKAQRHTWNTPHPVSTNTESSSEKGQAQAMVLMFPCAPSYCWSFKRTWSADPPP